MIGKKVLFLFILSIVLPVFYVEAGTILSSYKYAWGSKVGYINFENVVVGDSTLSGYAWSENTGWIKFNPALGGVLNDGTGNLSGSAWGEGLGWIDFNNVSINSSSGRFSGTATGDGVGTINFDCPNYCDVRTDWAQAPSSTPTPTPTPVSGSNTSGSSGRGQYVFSENKPLLLTPYQYGELKFDFNYGRANIYIPKNTLVKKTIFIIDEVPKIPLNSSLIKDNTTLINQAFYDIYAIDETNNYVRQFNNPITITLPIAETYRELKNLGLYWLNEVNNKWVLIPDAVFEKDKVTFGVNHLTRFAIFYLSQSVVNLQKKGEYSLDLTGKVVDSTESLASTTETVDFTEIEKEAESRTVGIFAKIWTWIWLPILIIIILAFYRRR